MRDMVQAIESEFLRYRRLGEGAFGQVPDGELGRVAEGGGNSMAILIQHLAGNLRSRFTDFLTSDGEKSWRDRESEFAAGPADRGELRRRWDEGWKLLLDVLGALSDADLGQTVHIRGQSLSVRAALQRSLAHTAYHVGQMAMLGRSILGERWRFLSIPPGASEAYLRAPSLDKAPVASAALQDDLAAGIVKAVTGPVWHGPALQELLQDVTAGEAASAPAAGRHSIGGIVRHIEYWCESARRRLPTADAPQGRRPPPAGEGADWPPSAAPDEAGWKAEQESLAERHRALAAEVRLLSPDRLAARAPGTSFTFDELLRGVVEHAAYHGGQIAVLRRSLRERGDR